MKRKYNTINEEVNRIKSLFTEERMYGNLIKEEDGGVGSIIGGVVAAATAGKNVTGCIKGDCENGQGTYIYDSGSKYVGEWKDGKLNGQGTMTWANGDKYVGEWKDGKKNGQGTLTYPSGGKYVGEFKDGKKNGKGTFTYADGSKEEVEWKDGKEVEIEKTNTDNSEEKPESEGKGCIKGDCENGQGTYIYDSGSKYVGEYKDGWRDGQGTYIYDSGSKYVGEWKDGEMNGQGTYIYDSGSKYVGEWKDGEMNGQGTYTWANGDKYVGEWKDDKQNGQGTYTYADGSIWHSGLWKDDEPVFTDITNTDDSDGTDEVEVFKDKGGKYHYTIIERNGGIEYWYSTDGENWKQQTNQKGMDAIEERINSDKVDSLGYVEMSSMGGIDPDLFIGVTTIGKDEDVVGEPKKNDIERIDSKPANTIDTNIGANIGDDIESDFGIEDSDEVVVDESDVTFKGCKKRLTGYIKLANDGTSMKDAFGDKVEEKTKDIQSCLGKYYNKFEKIGFMKKGKGVYLLKKLWDIDYDRNIDGGIEGQKYEIIVNNRSRGKVKRVGKNEYRVISKPNETIFGRDKNFRDGFEEAVFNSLDLPSDENDLIVAGIIQKGPIQWAKLLRKDV